MQAAAITFLRLLEEPTPAAEYFRAVVLVGLLKRVGTLADSLSGQGEQDDEMN